MDLISIGYQLALVLIGGLVAYYFTRRHYKEIKSEEASINKKQVVQSLLAELKANLSMLSEGLTLATNLRGKKLEWFNHPLYSNAYQSAKSSGKLILLSPETQTALSMYYERLELLENARSNSGATLYPKLYKESISAIKELIEALKDTYPLVTEALEQEIKKKENTR